MAHDGNGVFSPISNSWNPATAGTAIDEGDWADTLADIVAGLTKAICKDGQSTCSAAITFAQGIQVSYGGLKLYDSNSSHYVTWRPSTNVTAARTWSFDFGDADRTVTLGADFTLPAAPGADRLVFWDHSALATAYLTPGTGLTITTTTIAVDTASLTVSGIVELATAAETDAGTDATRAVTPDGLAGSNFGIKYFAVPIFGTTSNASTGDGKQFFHVPPALNGMNLVYVHAAVYTAGTTGTMDVQIRNVTDAVDMLSTKLKIDSTEVGTDTAATPPVIDTTKDDVATNDRIAIDVDAVHTTPAQGLVVTLGFQLP
jgi:hypothetical protein